MPALGLEHDVAPVVVNVTHKVPQAWTEGQTQRRCGREVTTHVTKVTRAERMSINMRVAPGW
jgi:hypothetical protein